MSLYIDIKYLNQIGGRLTLFKKKNTYLWNCRCPICGDSQKKKNLARGYFYRAKNDLFYKCHNCDASQHFGTFLKNFDGGMYREYALERYSNGENRRPHSNPEKDLMEKFNFASAEEYLGTEPTLLDDLMPRVSSLAEDHECRKFCAERKIPNYQLSRLYFIDDMRKIGQISEKMRDRIVTAEPRLVLPFRDRSGRLVGVTCRALRGESLRYIAVRIDEDAPQIFGWEDVNPLTTVYAVEGPIDSLFLPNAVAVGGTGFHRLGDLGVEQRRLTVVIDNQPRNREVVAVYKKIIDAGHNVFIWPNRFEACKDINDVVLANPDMSQRRLADIIDENTFSGLRAQAQFNVWKRV
jgi:hypothetical protein